MNTYAKVATQHASTGFTSPTLSFEKMRQINVSVIALNHDVTVNAVRLPFKQAWGTWFQNWTAFFTKYQSAFQKLGALTYSDELFQQVVSYEGDLVSWYDAYSRERDPLDPTKPLPPASGRPPVPNVPIPPSKGELPTPPDGDGLSVPWWVWLLGGAALVGTGYYIYRTYQQTMATKRAIEKTVVPAALGAYAGPYGGQFAQAYAARDMSAPVLMPMASQVSILDPSAPVVMAAPYSRYPGT